MATIVVSFHTPFTDIIKSLHARGHQIITTHPQHAQMLRDLDIPAKSLSELSSANIQAAAFQEAANILATTQPPKNGFGPGVKEFMAKGYKGFLYPRLADIISFVLILDQVVKPNLILVHNDVEPLLRAAAEWGKANSVPVLHTPHAVYLQIEKGEPGDDIHDTVTASHIACAGWFQKEWYERRGAKSLIPTGLPQFDAIAKIPHDPMAAKRQLGLNPHQPVVTYASSWRQDTNLLGCHSGVEDTYLMMLDVMGRLKEVQWIVKLHPRAGNADWHVQAADKAGLKGQGIRFTREHLVPVLQASDAILTYSGSNLLLEASFFPWLRLMATQGYQDDNEVVKVDTDPPNAEAAIEAIVGVLNRPAVDLVGFQEKYLGKTDGRASERIVGVIESLVSQPVALASKV